LILPFWPSLHDVKRETLKNFACGAFASGGACGGPSDTPFYPPSGGFVTDLRTTQGKTAGCWERGWTRGRVGRKCGDCDCGARGLRGLGGWIWGIRLQAPRGPALRARDSVAAAAAATWLDIARYSDTGGISQRYTPGGGFISPSFLACSEYLPGDNYATRTHKPNSNHYRPTPHPRRLLPTCLTPTC